MKCPKCGGEIPFFDLSPNCRHCGVNLMIYTQNEGLVRDAKRTELEAAAARMVIARVKANFIGGKLQILRLVALVASAAVLLIPFAGVRYALPFLEETLSVGGIGLFRAFQSGLLLQLPHLLRSTLLAKATLAAAVPLMCMTAILLLDLLLLALCLFGFLNLRKSTRLQKNAALIGACFAALSQAVGLLLGRMTVSSALASVKAGFGATAALAVYLILFFINRALLQKGIEPTYREYDAQRKALLRQVRRGETDLDDLPLPVFESEAERAARLQASQTSQRAQEEVGVR